jgi:hypothetical protein
LLKTVTVDGPPEIKALFANGYPPGTRPWEGLAYFQYQSYQDCVDAHWDPNFQNTFAEECAHIASELAEAFEAFRLYHDFEVHPGLLGKPEGVPIEFADILIGLLYCAERFGFDLLAAYTQKREWNRGRDYNTEGRQLHPPLEGREDA